MLSLEQFTEEMNKIQILFERDEKVNTLIEELSYDGYGFIYVDAINQIINLLEIIMEDTSTNWISYFIYELEFGKTWHPGTVTKGDKDEIDIPLKTIEDLYKFLVNNKKEKQL